VWHLARCAHNPFILLENKEMSGQRVSAEMSRQKGGSAVGLRFYVNLGGRGMSQLFQQLLRDEQGQDIAEYAVMLAVILVIVVGTIRLIGSNANNVFSAVASSIQ